MEQKVGDWVFESSMETRANYPLFQPESGTKRITVDVKILSWVGWLFVLVEFFRAWRVVLIVGERERERE